MLFAGGFEFIERRPLALSVARRSFGKEGVEDWLVEPLDCDILVTPETGGAAAFRCALAMISAKLLDGAVKRGSDWAVDTWTCRGR